MEFALYKNLRYGDNIKIEGHYEHIHCEYPLTCIHEKLKFDLLTAMSDYYDHLLALGFKRDNQLLQFFGECFFHDAQIVNYSYYPDESKYELNLVRLNDLEDINDIRNRFEMDTVSEANFMKNPIIYNCQFTKVTKVIGSLKRKYIMDTEIHKADKKRQYRILIGMSPFDEFELQFSDCTVNIQNKQKISNYLARPNTVVPPWCDVCRFRLVTLKDLKYRKKEIAKLIKKIKKV